MKIGLTGASGFIGRRVIQLAAQHRHEVIGYSRQTDHAIPGCLETRLFTPGRSVDVNGCDALIHLAGENVFGLWTKAKKKRIRESRQLGTRQIVQAIATAAVPPRVLVSGSAIGFYGDTGEVIADENSAPGQGFLTDVTVAWETEAECARERGVRVVLVRTGVVLGKEGGALRAMALPFRLGLGGRLGHGRQWMSWIHLDDEAALLIFAAENPEVTGPLNAVAPEPIRNADFTRLLAQTLHRSALIPAPKFALKALLGEFSSELLQSKRIVPRVALEHEFAFQFPYLEDAFNAELSKP